MLRIVVVDDEPMTRQFLKTNIPQLLERCRVTGEAMDGLEALEVLEASEADLVITDIKMPGMDGLTLCGHIAAKFPRMKMIILSGYDEFALAKEAIRHGVGEYLLKPLVREELRAALVRMADIVERERQADLSLKAITQLSAETKNQVIRHFMQAAITESNAEIQALLPLLHRMKVGLIESEAAIMVLAVDEETLLERRPSRSDLSLFRYVLYQVTEEIVRAQSVEPGIVAFDAFEQTIVLVGGDSEDSIRESGAAIHRGVADMLGQTSNIGITAAMGNPVYDTLQLHASWHQALQALDFRLPGGGGAFYRHAQSPSWAAMAEEAKHAVSSIVSGAMDGNEVGYTTAASHYLETIGTAGAIDADRLVRFALRLNRELETEMREAGHASGRALERLRSFNSARSPACRGGSVSRDEALKLLCGMIREYLRRPGENEPNEKEIVTRAKAFIYAHYPEPISLGLVAGEIGVSPNYLSSLFHKNVNEPYIKFLTRVRMEQAANLLRENPDAKIYDVAERVGYVSVKHFSHVFKQHFGMPPGEYQENLRRHPS